MARHSSSKNVGVDKLVEKQMRNWELARTQRATPPAEERPEVEAFVAVSRAVGASESAGANIPTTLGQRLGWPVFDKEILQAMSDNDRLRQQLYESLDERDVGWFEESLRSLMQGVFKKNDYFHRLTETMLAIARQGRTVFVGRAADLILPRARGLCVRLTASRDRCVKNFAEQHGMSVEEARDEVEQTESERAEFVEHHFKVQATDQNRHDLIINLEQFTADQAVELIMAALEMRGITRA